MLGPADFSPFFREVWGLPPFPWQEQLARRLTEEHRFPPALDLPTGVGKTSAIDIALFALAVCPEAFPRRIVLVVDRRVVVDQGVVRARKLAKHLAEAPAGSVADRVANRLREMWGGRADERPFSVAVLRGGMPRETAWAERPDRPLVAVSTVDQTGSRLLFRGYGLNDSTRPIHAGLLGNDVLYLLDEVHLSVPFAETLLAVERWQSRVPQALRRPFAVVPMSATLGPLEVREGEAFGLSEADRRHEGLSRRLDTSKPASLETVKVRGEEPSKKLQLAQTAAERARGFLLAGARAVLVVLNRVESARLTAKVLRDSASATEADIVLLTGRMRPLDRDRLLAEEGDLLPRLRAGRDRQQAVRPLIIVATQCIEAGADFDADALVTECASLDALRQRFGRLDRLGELRGGARAVILQRSDADKKHDPIYGEALAATWAWLGEIAVSGGVDFGISRLPEPQPERLAKLVAPPTHAPVLLPAHLDAWAQTSPRPEPDPDVALWLHGPERQTAEVLIVWRADIENEHPEAASSILAACPPSALEALALPIGAARAWLASEPAPPLADVPIEEETETSPPATEPRRALRWQGGDRPCELVDADDLVPGDTLVVPASWGGIASENWDPEACEPVMDLGDLAQWRQRGRLTLRLSPAAPAAQLGASSPPAPPSADEARTETEEALAGWLADLSPERSPERSWRESWREIVNELGRKSVGKVYQLRRHFRLITVPTQPEPSWVLIAKRRTKFGEGGELSTEGDAPSFDSREILLRDHLAAVSHRAQFFAKRLGLPAEMVSDLGLAARLHDVGKADPRFQRWLAGGSEIRGLVLAEHPLAKSAGRLDPWRLGEARRRAGYPEGERHELLSVVLVEAWVHESAADPALVLHLIESHHGCCRPFAPPVADLAPVPVALELEGRQLEGSSAHGLARLDSGVTERFWQLNERYGWWGLALLEAVLRLADHRVSEEERNSEPTANGNEEESR